MSDTGTAKLFRTAVRPCACRRNSACRHGGARAPISRGVLLEPIDTPFEVKAGFARMDEYLDELFMPDGRQQPPMPPQRSFFGE